MTSVNFAARMRLFPRRIRALAVPIPSLIVVAYIIGFYVFAFVTHAPWEILYLFVGSVGLCALLGTMASLGMIAMAWTASHSAAIGNPCVYCGFPAVPGSRVTPTASCSECGQLRIGPCTPPLRWKIGVTVAQSVEAIAITALLWFCIRIYPEIGSLNA